MKCPELNINQKARDVKGLCGIMKKYEKRRKAKSWFC
jgi:hypothetical protein